MASLAQFSKNIRKRGSQVENGSTALVRAVSKRALRALVRTTPVDKGVARSNWRVGIGGPPTATISAYAPGRHLGINEQANAAAAIAAGVARINSFSPGQGRRLQTAIYITNNVLYIEALNNGRSPQTPPGFIDAAMVEATAVIPNFRYFVEGPRGDDDGD